jgi:hypothetical protein
MRIIICKIVCLREPNVYPGQPCSAPARLPRATWGHSTSGLGSGRGSTKGSALPLKALSQEPGRRAEALNFGRSSGSSSRSVPISHRLRSEGAQGAAGNQRLSDSAESARDGFDGGRQVCRGRNCDWLCRRPAAAVRREWKIHRSWRGIPQSGALKRGSAQLNPTIQASKPANGRRFSGESGDPGNPIPDYRREAVFSGLALAHNRAVKDDRKA